MGQISNQSSRDWVGARGQSRGWLPVGAPERFQSRYRRGSCVVMTTPLFVVCCVRGCAAPVLARSGNVSLSKRGPSKQHCVREPRFAWPE